MIENIILLKKIKKYTVIILVFFLINYIGFAQSKNGLRFDGIYYWDNKKDTIIESNEAAYQKNNDLVIENFKIKNTPQYDYFYKGDSKNVKILRFYKDGTIAISNLRENFDLEKADKKLNRIKNNEAGIDEIGLMKYSLIKKDTICFEEKWFQTTFIIEGMPWIFTRMYKGVIMQDSILFKVTDSFPRNLKNDSGMARSLEEERKDSIRVFHFAPFK